MCTNPLLYAGAYATVVCHLDVDPLIWGLVLQMHLQYILNHVIMHQCTTLYVKEREIFFHAIVMVHIV